MLDSVKIAQLVQESEGLIKWLDKTINGLKIKSDTRTRLAAGCLDVALEHQKAIVLLIYHKLYGSAFSLIRLIFEAYARGVWLQWCASDIEVEQFKSGRFVKKFGELIQDIEKLEGFNVGVLSEVKVKSWKAMNDFTHSGYDQAVRRLTEVTIKPNYEEGEIVDSLSFANAMGLLTGMAIAFLADRQEVAISILEKANEFWRAEPYQEESSKI